jgi:uncharacterized protein
MQIVLKKRPKNPTIIEGFPGFGLVATIATEFLIDHLKTEQIGKIMFDDLPAMVAIHEGHVVEPLGIFYNSEYNIVIMHAISATNGIEWKLANAMVKLANELKAKEIVSLEGVGSTQNPEESQRTFYYTPNAHKKELFKKIGVSPLQEGIIMGVTGAVLLKAEHIPMSCIFAEAHTDLPDSKAAAKIVEVLDKYLGLKVDYKPLLLQAEKFEQKLKGIIGKTKEAEELSDKKRMSYVG